MRKFFTHTLVVLLTLAILAGTMSHVLALPPCMDVVFIIDTTGSMNDNRALLAATEKIKYFVREFEQNTSVNFKYALIDYRDFPERTTYSEDYPYKVQLDLSDADALDTALGELVPAYGGDFEETVYSAVIHGLGDVSWRDGSGKIAVLVGDAPALDPERYTGYMVGDAILSLQGKTFQKVKDLNAAPTQNPVEKQDAVQSAVKLFSISITPDDDPFTTFSALATESGGLGATLDFADDLLVYMLDYANSLPPIPDPPDPPPVVTLKSSMTLFHKDDTTVFASQDTPRVRWESTNPAVLSIDDNGRVTYYFAKIGDTTIKAIDSETNKELARTQVKVTWDWWQWILVVIAFGWAYL
ncbi:MAG: hypothetical protein LBB67_03105 [Oscillospiraceae bacterium]|jgi:hypothetical protein|nr:hypothetical protein [Oscillospiraceae bacterium]